MILVLVIMDVQLRTQIGSSAEWHHENSRIRVFPVFLPKNTDFNNDAWKREEFWKPRSPAEII